MATLNDLFKKSFLNQITMDNITPELALELIGVTALFGLYILMIYVIASRKSFYSPSFGKTLVGLTIITTSIILAMQASVVVSLGMVGALSIVRFRNAVKDALDLLFLFWAISIGIICGTGLFHIAIICSIAMTIVVLGVDYLPFHHTSYILVVNGNAQLNETDLQSAVKKQCRSFKVRTKSATQEGTELLVEVRIKNHTDIVTTCMAIPNVTSVSLLCHDGEICY